MRGPDAVRQPVTLDGEIQYLYFIPYRRLWVSWDDEAEVVACVGVLEESEYGAAGRGGGTYREDNMKSNLIQHCIYDLDN